MSENNAKGGFFDIDMRAVDLKSYDFDKYEKIQIFILSNTLPNPYLLVMFGLLKRFLEEIGKVYPDFQVKLSINFILIHEIGKHGDRVSFFEPVKEHYRYFIPPDVKIEDQKEYISSIIDLRFNEFMTLANTIMLNFVDKNTERLLITKDRLLSCSYDDIQGFKDKIGEEDKDVNDFMKTIENNNNVRMPKSELLKDLLLKKVDKKDELLKCLLRIFCHELREGKRNDHKKDAIFFIIDRWFKHMIEDYIKDTSQSSSIFEEIHKLLICPKEDPPEPKKTEKVNLYLNPLSEYIVAKTELDTKYFSSLVDALSCRLFMGNFKMFHSEYDKYSAYSHHPNTFSTEIQKSEERLQEFLKDIVLSGFLTSQENILAQLSHIP